MRLKHFSIRARVFAVAIVALLLSSLALVVFLGEYAKRSADRAFDRLLAASALSISGAVRAEDNDVTLELPYAALGMLSSQERVFYSVRNTLGELVTGYDDLDADMPLATSSSPVFGNGQYHGEEIRIATLGRLVSINQKIGWVTIRVAETREARKALATEILQRGAATLPIMAAVALLLIWFGITRALAPLRGIEHELRRRSPDELTPLSSPAPREVRRLVEALNSFMQRLRTMLDTLNNLVADAAHQVRTPLASLRAQAEVALDDPDPASQRARLERIHLNATHASILVNQLLMDATITHRIGTHTRSPVAIQEIIHETRTRIGTVDSDRLHIHIAADVCDAHIPGDRIALREMLRNLVDNALRHASDGPVEVMMEEAGYRQLTIKVSDRGPGIPGGEKRRLLQRFTRGRAADSTPGSGLGLAIVKAVVDSHGGRLALYDRPGGGLEVRITLPLTARRTTLHRKLPALCAGALLATLLAVQPGPGWAQPAAPRIDTHNQAHTTVYPAKRIHHDTLTLAGPTDTPVFGILADSFQTQHPDVTLVYHELDSRTLYEYTVTGRLSDTDVLISSAVDLQLKLANDGYAMRHESSYTRQLPDWAIWRSEVFGFTLEPIVMVYNTDRYTADSLPRSRPALLKLLEDDTDSLHGRIGTYDIIASSVGHLLAVQDEMISSNFWGLANAMGRAGVELVANTATILDKIEAGELDLGYNVLGSYALARISPQGKLGIIPSADYQLALPRTALILRTANQPALAGLFVDWLLSPAGQAVIDQDARLGRLPGLTPVDTDRPPATERSLPDHDTGIIQPIGLNPVLLVGLDQQRHRRFRENWLRLVTDTPPRPQP